MKLHIGSLIILFCGLCALIPGLLTLLGYGHIIHELLDQPIGGVALVGIGLCGVAAALFPGLIRYLTERERNRDAQH